MNRRLVRKVVSSFFEEVKRDSSSYAEVARKIVLGLSSGIS